MDRNLPAVRSETKGELSNAREIPRIIIDAGNAARFAWEEFFFGKIRSPHTRRAYHRAVRDFLQRCETRGLPLTAISPADVGGYLLTFRTPKLKLAQTKIGEFEKLGKV